MSSWSPFWGRKVGEEDWELLPLHEPPRERWLCCREAGGDASDHSVSQAGRGVGEATRVEAEVLKTGGDQELSSPAGGGRIPPQVFL